MSNRYQIIVLQKGLTVALFAMNWLGLWSFRFVHSKRQIKYSGIKAFYSIFVLCVGLCAYNTIGKIAFHRDDDTIFFGSFTLKLVQLCYAYSILASFAGAYLEQHWFAKEIELTYIKCMDVVEAMRDFIWDVDLSSPIIEIILKTIVFDICHGVTTFNNISNSSDVIKAKPHLGYILIIPQILVRLHLNILYGTLVAINVYVTKLNGYLLHIVTRAASIAGQHSTKHQWLAMDSYCHFSDEIDKLSALYVQFLEFNLCCCTNFLESNNVSSFNRTILATFRFNHRACGRETRVYEDDSLIWLSIDFSVDNRPIVNFKCLPKDCQFCKSLNRTVNEFMSYKIAFRLSRRQIYYIIQPKLVATSI